VTGVQSRLSTLSFGNSVAWQTVPVRESGGVGDRPRTVSRPAILLARENWTASEEDGEILLRQGRLRNLMAGVRELKGRHVHLRGRRRCDPHRLYQPYDGGEHYNGRFWPSDPFVQVQCYANMDRLCRLLKQLGYDFEAIQASIHQGRYHPIRVFVNLTNVRNAEFSNLLEVHSFGRHVALDGDVVVHEGGHGLWYHINPFLMSEKFSKEAGAIHEGSSDAFAAILHGNPVFGEDFSVIADKSADPRGGLRLLKNDSKMSDVSDDSHDRGEVYGGFFWDLYEHFRQDSRLERFQANELALRLIVNHWFHYKTFHPAGVDFVDAVLSGAKALDRVGKLPLPFVEIERLVTEGAVTREIIPREGGRRVFLYPVPSVDQIRQRYAEEGPVRFRKVGGAPYLGGRTEIYQQQVQLKTLRTEDGKPLRLDVVGHGMTAWVTGEGMDVSLHDIRPLKEGEIIEKVNQTPQDILEKLRDRLRREIRLSEEKMDLLRGHRRDEAAGQIRLMRRAAEAIRSKESEVEIKLVAMRGKKGLYYEVEVSSGTHYFAAYVKDKKSETLHHKMVFSTNGSVKVF
ncbi:MAG: hypothetical protein HYT77_10800, partial [Deltaproteobacteria bacterium]|nr:hypothetical protein [Deltaproteobacteria bacterium]